MPSIRDGVTDITSSYYWSMIRHNKINFDLSRPLIRLHFIKIVDTMIILDRILLRNII